MAILTIGDRDMAFTTSLRGMAAYAGVDSCTGRVKGTSSHVPPHALALHTSHSETSDEMTLKNDSK
jgi:hypothetical protein